jgi:hypothetical protein
MAVARTNHSGPQTEWSAAASPSVELSDLETRGGNIMAAERPTAPELQTTGPGPDRPTSSSSLEIVVLHTAPKETLSALKMAAELASGLAPVRLLAVQIVPYPLDLCTPPVSTAFLESRFEKIVSEAAVNASIDIRLGRDTGDVVEAGVASNSVVVIGGRRRWWPTASMRLARRLERSGHQVVFTN